MGKQKGTACFFVLLGLLIQVSLTKAETPEAILSYFYPYDQGAPHIEGITPGITISQQNWQIAKEALPEEILQLLRAGDFTLKVQETTNLPMRKPYIQATLSNFQSVSLNGGYAIEHHQGGLPFPLIDKSDPRAGEKLAWNFRYRDIPQTMEMRATMRKVNKSGRVMLYNKGRMLLRQGTHRVGTEKNEPQWQEQGVFFKALFEMLAPSDWEGFLRIMTVYEDNSQAHNIMVYSPQIRRIRKTYANMLERMGGGRYDALQEEQPPFFFIGYVQDYNWTYKGQKTLLVPGFLKAKQITFGGRANWYPEVPWELRRVWVLECVAKEAHPYPKRVFYLDAQTYTPFYVLSYGAKGNLTRLTLIVHGQPDFVPGSQGVRLPVPLGATWITPTQRHASQFIASKPVFNRKISSRRFDMMELMRRGK